MARRISMSRKVYLLVASVFLIFVISFIIFQFVREKQYKVSNLEMHLQDFNRHMDETLRFLGSIDEDLCARYTRNHTVEGQRVTVFDLDGHVIFDSHCKDYASMDSLARRPEVRMAMESGEGSDIDRSSTFNENYFYSATRFNDPDGRLEFSYIIRTALPCDRHLDDALRADQHYLWFALGSFVVLILGLRGFILRLSKNINKLQLFAARADRSDSLDIEEFADFPNDELGEVADRIIKLYKRLQTTKNEQAELKRQLTENIAHELKTPVASINGYLETIISNPNLDDEQRRQFLQRCYAQSERLTHLLRDISTLNNLDDSPWRSEYNDVSINDIVTDIQRNTELDMQSRQMTLDNRLPASVAVHGDHSMLYGVFDNLLSNAIAYAGDGTTVTIEAERTGKTWHFTFKDNGVGVPPEHLERIFERFYRIDKGRSRKMGGTGLGLSIVKNIVLRHSGTIAVSNQPEGGLRFDFDLPAAQ